MKQKHRLAAGLFCLVLAAGLALPACAHPRDENHRSRCGDTGASFAGPCPYGDCIFNGPHRHDGTPYCGHGGAGGSCPYNGCTLEGWHTHDGTSYCGHSSAGTPGTPCPYGDCTLEGWHLHDGTPYCGRAAGIYPGSDATWEEAPAPRGGHHGHGGGHHGGHC